MFLPHFDVFCDLLLNRRKVTWDLFVLNSKEQKTVNRVIYGSFLQQMYLRKNNSTGIKRYKRVFCVFFSLKVGATCAWGIQLMSCRKKMSCAVKDTGEFVVQDLIFWPCYLEILLKETLHRLLVFLSRQKSQWNWNVFYSNNVKLPGVSIASLALASYQKITPLS